MIDLKEVKSISPIYLNPGDSLTIIYTDEFKNTGELIKHDIDDSITIDTVKIYSFTNEFGMTKGYLGAMGTGCE